MSHAVGKRHEQAIVGDIAITQRSTHSEIQAVADQDKRDGAQLELQEVFHVAVFDLVGDGEDDQTLGARAARVSREPVSSQPLRISAW